MNTDYTLEGGASRNFEAAKTAEMLAQKAQKEIEEEELNNPMKVGKLGMAADFINICLSFCVFFYIN